MLEKVLSVRDKEGKIIIPLGDANGNFSPETFEKYSTSENLHSIYNLYSFKQIINETAQGSVMSSRNIL